MAYFLDNAGRFDAPLLVNSTPLLVRSLQGVSPYGHRDLTPVAALVADYGVFVVRADDARADWDAVPDSLGLAALCVLVWLAPLMKAAAKARKPDRSAA